MYSFVIRSARRRRRLKLALSNLSLYCVAHAVVDAACAALVLSHLYSGRTETAYFAFLILIYNALAFAGQPLIGFFSDKYKLSYEVAIAGCVATTVSVFLYVFPMLSVVLAGIGNAMFHVGGGVTSLNLYRGKAAAPGIFVAPGAFGLMIGTLIGRSGSFSVASFAFLLLCCGAGILFIKQPHIDYSTSSELSFEPYHIIMLLLLGSISIRSFIGIAVNFTWKSDVSLLVCLTLAIVLGKALGGILGDKFGWRKVTVAGLILSAPLVAAGNYPLAGILGMFLFNLTMPVTLTAVANLLPGYPGFAFGMTTLALVTGVFIMYLPFTIILSSKVIAMGIILISAFMLNKALTLYFNDSLEEKIKKIDINI
ncbi:MAG: putative efflux protein [Clostridia bacterium]|nr:putative efflux protein [Clostridia bacterium]